ncbi:3-isopropylmalate dehydratase small subunit [Pseudobacteriovorax antillogorgiicola]|uniref:3-isopropylmalate dehydratase n=1 Tax=Pseudobacteriovorax antillogorgiicola TaxID=1513793 RepID=A0A1Y6CD74_9BACT|nr:isopropylmalate isomerase [Pseudobacteriovorax antillogorgiicola]TCS51676.1 3-isopropylmalate dehydratase small subunit [Pseudobacteriovorax antillogorgiicola]SMF49006.1 3-isopropylmalate dehydratase, small subunit [Pseudobacteriovorax antillogorgiicola]
MNAITSVRGLSCHLPGSDIDTDQIIPARFLKQITFDHLGDQLFFDQRFSSPGTERSHPLNHRPKPSIIVADENFGCGSSREHAPQALKKYGIEAILALSFGPIFQTNCQQLGIPCLTLSPEVHNELKQCVFPRHLEICLESLQVSWGGRSKAVFLTQRFQDDLLAGTYDPLENLMKNADLAEQIHCKTELPIPSCNR